MTTMRLNRDPYWWAALSCGPIFWALLLLGNAPVFSPARLQAHILPFVLIALIYPVLEEVVFRGGIQQWLSERLSPRRWLGISPANILASLLFAGMHFFHHPPLWAASVFVPSLAFGFFWDRYHSLRAPILLHVFYNTGYALFFVEFASNQ